VLQHIGWKVTRKKKTKTQNSEASKKSLIFKQVSSSEETKILKSPQEFSYGLVEV